MTVTNEEKADILDCLVDAIKNDKWDRGCIGCRDIEICKYILKDDIWENLTPV